MKHETTSISPENVKFLKMDQEAWGDRSHYRIEPEDLPENHEKQTFTFFGQYVSVKIASDGSGYFTTFRSIVD